MNSNSDNISALYEPPRGWIHNREKWREQVNTIRAIERDRVISIVLRTIDQEEKRQKKAQTQTEKTKEPQTNV